MIVDRLKKALKQAGAVWNTKLQKNNLNCYIPAVHLFYGVVFKHSRDIEQF